MDLSIIIVNWNSRDHVRKCVQSIYAHTRGLTFEIIVVDGGSHDGCGQMLAREFPQVRFVQSGKNVGFGGANNLAFEHARGDCVLFLNPDTELAGPAINRLHAALTGIADAGIVGGRLLNTDGTLQTSCVQAFPTILNQLLNAEALHRVFPRLSPWNTATLAGAENPVAVEVLSGACLMLRRATFEQIGGFSSDYFMYAEDLDLCHKSRQAGWKNYHVPAAVIVHHGGGSSCQWQSDFSNVLMRESIYRFLRKTRGQPYAVAFRTWLGIGAVGRLALIGLLLPFHARRDGRNSARHSFRKWKAILRWTWGLESWASKMSGSDCDTGPTTARENPNRAAKPGGSEVKPSCAA